MSQWGDRKIKEEDQYGTSLTAGVGKVVVEGMNVREEQEEEEGGTCQRLNDLSNTEMERLMTKFYLNIKYQLLFFLNPHYL